MAIRLISLGAGLGLGIFLTLLWIASLGGVGYESLEPSNPGGPSEGLVLAILAVPCVVAAAHLGERVVRRRPAGLWTGAAFGALVGSGVWLVPGLG
ncbi:MAG: hypothetical protein ABIO16_06725 [Nocardioides sp.]